MKSRNDETVPTTIPGWEARIAELNQQLETDRGALSEMKARHAGLAAAAYARRDRQAAADLAALRAEEVATALRVGDLEEAIGHCREEIAKLQQAQVRIDAAVRAEKAHELIKRLRTEATAADAAMKEAGIAVRQFRSTLGALQNVKGVLVPGHFFAPERCWEAGNAAGLGEFLGVPRHVSKGTFEALAGAQFDRTMAAIRIYEDGGLEFPPEAAAGAAA